MEDRTRKHWRTGLRWVPALLALVVLGVALFRRWQRKLLAERLPRPRPPAPPPIPLTLEGLTEAEAEARRMEGQDNAIPFRPRRSWRRIVRENIFTIFNLSLVGLALAQLLLGLPLDALISLGMIGVNAALNFGQEAFARVRLRDIEAATRLKATVIRDSKVHSVDPNDVVLGDILVAGPGDHLLVDGTVVGDGEITVDESLLTGDSRRLVKRTGDPVYSGSFCLSGRAAYKAETVGQDRQIIARLAGSRVQKEELTPLEQVVARILRLLLLVVAAISVLLLFKYFNIETPVDSQAFADAVSVVFSIAPASLFFMIFLTYAAGTADLGKLGALVHRARAVESLANATAICFAQAGILTGTHVELEMLDPPAGQAGLAESRVRQILGDFVRSTSMTNLVTRALTAAFEGSRRAVLQEAPYLAAYGWSASVFDDDDLRGVYVLAEPHLVEGQLPDTKQESLEEEHSASPVAALRKRLPSVGRLFRRSGQDRNVQTPTGTEIDPAQSRPNQVAPGPVPPAAVVVDHLPAGEEEQQKEPSLSLEEDGAKPNLFRRTMSRVRHMLPRREPKPDEAVIPEEEAAEEERLMVFAYCPDIVPLHDPSGAPRLPEGLIPLCHLRYSERVRPEAIETIRGFAATGVRIKIFASGPPTQTAAVLHQAGLHGRGDGPPDAISGSELAQMDAEQRGMAIQENQIFGQVAPEQIAEIVRTLRNQGEAVALVGDSVKDVPGMRQASLSIARHSSSQAALSVADIILLEDSPKALLDVLEKGQRIANGLLDVLKLYLVQMLYLTLLILLIWVFAHGFPYASKQGTIIAVVTVSLPAAALSLWAAPGMLPTRRLNRILARFVVPAALTIGVAGLLVYLLFLERTGDRAYAQLGVTYALVGMGLLLVLFVRPPSRLWVGSTSLSGDRRFTAVVAVLLVAFFFLAWIPLAYQFFLLERLHQPSDYAIVGLAILGWAIIVRLIWWLIPLLPAPRRLGPKRPSV